MIVTANQTQRKRLTEVMQGIHQRGWCDGTRVAMVQDPAPLSQQGNAMIHQPLGQETILLLKRSGHTDESVNINLSGGPQDRLHPIEGPAEVDGGWP